MSRPGCIFSLVFTVYCLLHVQSPCQLLWILMILMFVAVSPSDARDIRFTKNELLPGC